MADLSGQTIASSYEQLLSLPDGGGNANTLVAVTDGDGGTTFGIKLATNKVEIIPGSNDANAFEVSQADGTAVLTVDSTNARVGIGKNNPGAILDVDSGATGESDSEACGIRVTLQRNGSAQGLTLRHEDASGGSTDASEGTSIQFQGYDGSNSYHNLAAIFGRADGESVSDSDSPGFLTFHTTPDGSDSFEERMRIDSSGEVQVRNASGGNLRLIRDDTTTTSGETLGRLLFSSTDGGVDTADASAVIEAIATEDFTTGNKGAKLEFSVKPNADDVDHNDHLALTINQDQSANFTDDVIIGTQQGSKELMTNRARMRHIDGVADADASFSHGDLFINHISTGNIFMQRDTTFAGDVLISKNDAKLTVFASNTGDKEAIVIDRNTASNGDSQEIRFKLQGDSFPGGYILHEFVDANNSRFAFGTRQSGTPATALLINETGNVGVGETSPTDAKLHVGNVAGGDMGVKIQQTQGQVGLFIDQDGNGIGLNIDHEATTNPALQITDSKVTTSRVLQINDCDALTSGYIANFHSGSTSTTARNLVNIHNDHADALDGICLFATQDANGIALKAHCTKSDFANVVHELVVTRDATSAYKFLRTFVSGQSDEKHNLKGDGSTQGDNAYSSPTSDYAEYFESKDGSAIAVGTTVKLDGEKIVVCESGDTPIGVIRPYGTASVIGNNAWSKWNKKYLTDDYGSAIMEEYTVTEWIDGKREDGANNDIQYHTDKIPSDVVVPDDATVTSVDENGNKLMRNKLNPDYDENKTYIPREDRDEWNIVGLLGQVEITKGQPVASNWIKMKDISDTVELWFIK